MSPPKMFSTPNILGAVGESWRDNTDAVLSTPFLIPYNAQHYEGCNGEN